MYKKTPYNKNRHPNFLNGKIYKQIQLNIQLPNNPATTLPNIDPPPAKYSYVQQKTCT